MDTVAKYRNTVEKYKNTIEKYRSIVEKGVTPDGLRLGCRGASCTNCTLESALCIFVYIYMYVIHTMFVICIYYILCI